MVLLKAFALQSDRGLQYALVMDGTNKTVAEIREMSPTDRMATALVRARFYKEQSDAADRQQQGGL